MGICVSYSENSAASMGGPGPRPGLPPQPAAQQSFTESPCLKSIVPPATEKLHRLSLAPVASAALRVSSRGSPSSTSLSVSMEGPFTGYNPAAWGASTTDQQSDDSTGSVGGGRDEHRKSASIDVLQRISRDRNSRHDSSFSRGEDYLPASRGSEAAVDSARKSLTARTRRLSSKFNDIPQQMERYLPRGENENMVVYLRRLFNTMDTAKKGVLSVGEVAMRLFPSSERRSISTTLSFADTSPDGLINAEQFIKFFAHLSGRNCLGPEFDLEMESTMGLSTGSLPDSTKAPSLASSTSGSPRAPARKAAAPRQLLSAVALPGENGPHALRDVRVKSLTGQSERIKCVAMSADPCLYAVSHRHDNIAHIHTINGKEVRQLSGHGDSLLGIAFSPDRKYVATVSRDRLLVVWDCTVGLECHSVEHPGIVTAVAFAHDGKNVYTGCQDNLTRKISFPKGKLRATIPELPNAEGGVIVSLAAQHTKNESIVFSRSCDEHAYVARADNLALCMQLNGHETLVWQTAFSSNDEYVLTCCEKKIIVWRTKDFAPVGDFDSCAVGPGLEDNACLWTTAVFGPLRYKNLLFAFNTCNQILVLDMNEPEKGALMDLQLRSSVYAVATADHSDRLVCGDDLGNVYQLQIS